ncbi:MAG: hypothetical protein ACAH59_00700 [Pseudobdellovibrionaceae bacterium]
MTKAKRRPGRDPEMSPAPGDVHGDVAIVDVEESFDSAESVATSAKHDETPTAHATAEESSRGEDVFEETLNSQKVELNFKGSEILRAKFPKPFEVAEQIATDWIQDGRFEGLPLGHPLAQYFAAKGLRRAKELEKKVMESPVTEKLAMQALTAGMKAQEIVNQVRSKVKKDSKP